MENSNPENPKKFNWQEEISKISKNKDFLFGLSTGIALISSVALIILVVFIMSGDRLACMAQPGSGSSSTVGKTAKNFEQCLDSGKYDVQIDDEMMLGLELGVQGTPATFINGYLVSGALPYEMVEQVIEALLAGQEPNFDFLMDYETGEIIKADMPPITDQDHVMGAKNGKITMVSFSDFECPYCARFKLTADQILENYPNDVTLVFKHFPLSFHQYALPAAVASECAAEQGKFKEMHDKLFELTLNQKLNTENIKKAALEIGLK